MKQFYHILLLLFFSCQAKAQTYLKVTKLDGTQLLAGNAITVTPVVDTIRTHNACGVGPYRLNSCMKEISTGNYAYTETGYNFSFQKPVRSVQFEISGMDSTAIYGFYVNGNFYPLANSNVSPSAATCGFGPYLVSNGYLMHPTNGNSAGATILLNPGGYKIDSVYIRVEAGNYDRSGIHFSFLFEAELEVTMPQFFTDTFMCINDSAHIGYNTNLPFYAGNIFRAELSDSAGSFANPVVIGQKTGNSTGIIGCKIPSNIIRGSKYRVRVASDKPALISADNGKDINMSPFPSVIAIGADTICEGEPISLSAITDQQAIIIWRGPNNFYSNDLSTTIEHAQMAAKGKYVVSASFNTCTSRDTIDVFINPTPAIIEASSNTPICDGETLTFVSNSSIEKATHSWSGPNGYTFKGKSANINNASPVASGTYHVTASLNGCNSQPGIVQVRVKPNPTIDFVANNSPIKAGNDLRLEVKATEGANFLWNGPDEFKDTSSTPSIIQATNANEGEYFVTAMLEGCTVNDKTKVIIMPNREYKMFPNPVRKDFEIEFFVEKDQNIPLQIFNLNGQEVYKEVIQCKKGFLHKKIITESLSNGVYLFRTTVDGEKINARITVVK